MKFLKSIAPTLLFLFTFNLGQSQTCAEFFYYGSGLTKTFVDTNYCMWGSISPDPNNTTWNFGDSTSQDTGKIVIHTFSSPGTYYVTMTAYDANMINSTDSTIQVVIGSVSNPGCASFSHTVSTSVASFTNTSNCLGASYTYWDFGDGSSTNTNNPLHVYQNTGSFVVIMYKKYGSTVIDSFIDTVVINSLPSNCASFSHSTSGNYVTLTNTSTCPSQNQYMWDFGDGHTSLAQNPVHVFSYTGTYIITLKVFLNGALLDSIQDTTVVSSITQTCGSFNAVPNYNTVNLTSTSVCSNQGMYRWYFGNGQSAWTSSTNTSYSYTNLGSYNISLVVYDTSYNKLDSVSNPVNLTSFPPFTCANYSFNKSFNQVSFTNTSICAGQATYHWDFGDGSASATGSNAFHVYNSNGTFSVELDVKDSNGVVIDSVIKQVNIYYVGLCASFTYAQSNNQVSFTSTSNCAFGNYNSWSFGDGSYGNGSNVTHTYASNGSYQVTLSVTDSSQNLLDTAHITIVITNQPNCNALFTKNQALDSNNNPISGHVVISDQSTGGSLSYLWDFGDGNSSTLQNPSHTYSGNGPYLLCLTVSNATCTDTYCDTISIDTNGNLLRRAPGFSIHVGGYNPTIGLEEFTASDLKVFPNPFNNTVSLQLNKEVKDAVLVSIFNIHGQEVFTQQISAMNSNQVKSLNVSHIEPGIYFLQLNIDGKTIQQKLMKE